MDSSRICTSGFAIRPFRAYQPPLIPSPRRSHSNCAFRKRQPLRPTKVHNWLSMWGCYTNTIITHWYIRCKTSRSLVGLRVSITLVSGTPLVLPLRPIQVPLMSACLLKLMHSRGVRTSDTSFNPFKDSAPSPSALPFSCFHHSDVSAKLQNTPTRERQSFIKILERSSPFLQNPIFPLRGSSSSLPRQ